MSNAGRIAAVIGCCVLAAITPFIAGTTTAALGFIVIGCALWLVARSEWSYATRLVASAGVVVATLGFVIGLLALATLGSGD